MTSKYIHLEIRGEHKEVAVIRLARGAKRNALSDGVMAELARVIDSLPSTVRAAVLDGEGEHFCAGLDLSELKERDAGRIAPAPGCCASCANGAGPGLRHAP